MAAIGDNGKGAPGGKKEKRFVKGGKGGFRPGGNGMIPSREVAEVETGQIDPAPDPTGEVFTEFPMVSPDQGNGIEEVLFFEEGGRAAEGLVLDIEGENASPGGDGGGKGGGVATVAGGGIKGP